MIAARRISVIPPFLPPGVCEPCYRAWRVRRPLELLCYCEHSLTVAIPAVEDWVLLRGCTPERARQMQDELNAVDPDYAGDSA